MWPYSHVPSTLWKKGIVESLVALCRGRSSIWITWTEVYGLFPILSNIQWVAWQLAAVSWLFLLLENMIVTSENIAAGPKSS